LPGRIYSFFSRKDKFRKNHSNLHFHYFKIIFQLDSKPFFYSKNEHGKKFHQDFLKVLPKKFFSFFFQKLLFIEFIVIRNKKGLHFFVYLELQISLLNKLLKDVITNRNNDNDNNNNYANNKKVINREEFSFSFDELKKNL